MMSGIVGVTATDGAQVGAGQINLPFFLILEVRLSVAWRAIHSQPLSFESGTFISRNHSRKILPSRVFARLSPQNERSADID